MGSGGGSAHTPKLLDDNLKSKQFYKVLDLVSEGPIYGPVDQQYLSSFMLNDTPVTTPTGTTTVNGISVSWRPGSETQDVMTGFGAIEATTIINTEIEFDTPLVRTVTDTDVTRVRFNLGVSSLVESDDDGDQNNTSVTMVIETRTGTGAFVIQDTVTITGKISGEYLEAHTIAAPDTKPFDIRVRRITADSTKDTLTNGTVWNSYTEIIDDSLSYPFSAIVGTVIDRDQYQDTPKRTYHARGLIVDIPDNYDPVARTYTGLWTGGFTQAWTNNPAWLFRELVTNNRFGLARRAGSIDVDDGALYTLSQFCDQLVDDGYGGQEPRMTLNAYITEQTTARDLLDKIAGMFRGIALYDGMRMTALIDTPADPVMPITNANVVDGKFSYSSSKSSELYNAVVVSWTDPDNGWKQSKEYVSDDALISRNGYNETTIEAFGCTSRGQAYRAGRYLLETAKRESKKVTFKMARDAIGFTPGDIIEVMDNNHASARLGGRIVSHSGAQITVDADISTLAASGDSISIMGSTGALVKYEISSVSGSVITLQSTPAYVRDGTVFVISTANLATRLFRILSIKEAENNSTYDIVASLHDPNKEAVVDSGAVFDAPNDTLNGYRVPNVERLTILNVDSETVQVTATWETATTTRRLTFELCVYTEDGSAVVARYETDQFRYDFYGLAAGTYILGVRGRNDNGMKGAETQVSLVIGAPAAPASVVWTAGIFSADLVPVMKMSATSDTTFEFWYSDTQQITDATTIEDAAQFLGRSSQWTLHGLKADTTYYVYVRTRNAFGVSDFVEASGQASADIPGMIDFIDEAIRDSGAFDNLQKGVDTNLEGILQNALANNSTVNQQYAQFGEVRADIITIRTTIADIDGAFSELADYVQAQIGPDGSLMAAVNQKLTAQVTSDGTASAYYTLNLGIQRSGQLYNAGMAIGIEPDGSGSYKSTTVFAADQFGIYSGSDPGNYEAAFLVNNGQVFINSAFIQDGSITNAKIGNYIQSTNYVSGSAGWSVNKSGAAEFNTGTFRGALYASNGAFAFNGTNNTVVIDDNGVTVNLTSGGFIRLGKW